MNIHAVICDVYKTILEVSPPPADAEARWQQLCREMLGSPAPMNLAEFASACERVIAREHAAARNVGVQFPEIYWPAITAEAMSPLAKLPDSALDEFLFRHAQLQRTLRLMPGAAEGLREMREAKLLIGIASNSQPYTLRELDEALRPAGLSRDLFDADICFWSFRAGFSKPNPHAFQWLTARLRARGVLPGEILMVGDRLDNDIAPAGAHGWQTWHLDPSNESPAEHSGDWTGLRDFLRKATGGASRG